MTQTPMTQGSQRFTVLHVCTGNICRSPMAERLMRAGLADRGITGIVVVSAGTWGHSGSPMEADALRVLEEHGVDGGDFTARELVAEDVAEADLVLAATREHRAAAVVLHPRAASRTFTLRELARLLEGVSKADLSERDPVARAQELVACAAARRGRTTRPEHPRDDDLSDPYHAPLSQFARCADLVARAVAVPLDLLGSPVR